MNLFTPPTDSLYKFISILGMALVITGFVLYFSSIPKESELAVKYQGEERILEKKIEMMMDEMIYNRKYKKLNNNITTLFVNIDSLEKDPFYKEMLYNFPDSTKNNFSQILLKKAELENNKVLKEDSKSTFEVNSHFTRILACLGLFITYVGLILWYYRIEKPLREKTKLEQNKFLGEDLWQVDCQSCYKIIYSMSERGTESDGKRSRMYCYKCYQNGKFVEPDLEFIQARERLINELKKLKYSRFRIYIYSRRLKRCIRWASKNNW